jgi:hypothetical protein
MWPSTKEGILIFGRKILDLFRDPVGLIPTGLTAAVFLWGSVSWFKRDRDLCSPFLVIIALAILLSALGQYPLLGRLLLFLLPAIYLVIAEGLNSIIGASLWRKVLGVGIFLVLLIQPLALASRSVTPVESVDIRSITFYWKDHQLPGDKLFINMESFWGYAFYAWEFQSDKIGIFGNQPGRDDAGEYVKFGSFYDSFLCKMYAPERLLRMEGEKLECLLTQLPRNKRTWVLLSQINPETEKFIIKNFDQWGKRVNVVKRHSASLYLYDTSAATYPY